MQVAMLSGYDDTIKGQRPLDNSRHVDQTSAEPQLMNVSRAATDAALRISACRVVGDGEEDDDDVEDRGRRSQAKFLPGIVDWPPRPFLARQKGFTRPCQVYLLK